MKQPSEEAVGDHCEVAAIVDTDVDGSHITEHAIDGNDPAVLVKLDKDAKESKTDAETDDSKGSEVQYNAKENTAKDLEREENEKPLEEKTKGSRDFENVHEVAEKSFEKVDEVAEKVADGMVVEVMSSHELQLNFRNRFHNHPLPRSYKEFQKRSSEWRLLWRTFILAG